MGKPTTKKAPTAKVATSRSRAAKDPEPTGAPEALNVRIRAALARRAFTEQKMFGGTCFLINGNMLVGASKRGLLVRLRKEAHADAVTRPHARPMEMQGRTMEGYIYVDPAGLESDKDLRSWIRLALAHVATLPPKVKANAKKGAAARARA